MTGKVITTRFGGKYELLCIYLSALLLSLSPKTNPVLCSFRRRRGALGGDDDDSTWQKCQRRREWGTRRMVRRRDGGFDAHKDLEQH